MSMFKPIQQKTTAGHNASPARQGGSYGCNNQPTTDHYLLMFEILYVFGDWLISIHAFVPLDSD